MTIFIQREGQQYGPYTLEDVQRYMGEGCIISSDLARTSEMSTPVALSSLLATIDARASSNFVAALPQVSGGTPASPSVGNLLTWPFHYKRWWASLWMPLLWWIPVFGALLSLGWSIGVIRRRAKGRPELPPPSDLGTVFKDGAVVTLMAVVYFVLPTLFFGLLLQYQLLALMLHIVKGGWLEFIFNPAKVLAMVIEKQSLEYVLLSGIVPIICVVTAWPFFVIGELHYADTGKIRSFFNIFGNLGMMFRHLGGFLSYLFFVALIRLGLYGISTILTPVLAVTIVLSLVAFVVPPLVAHWMTAHLAGTLAREMFEGKILEGSQAS